MKYKKSKEGSCNLFDNAPFVNPRAPSTYSFSNSLVRLVASGIISNFEFTPHVFIRKKTGRSINYASPVSVKNASDRWVLFDTPDEEVLFTRENVTIDGDRPFNDLAQSKWDYSISLGFANKCGDDLPIDRFMINPQIFIDSTEPRSRDPETINTTSKLIMSDSAGYQLGYGGLDFINPKYLVSFYKRNADEGVVLDIPTRALIMKGSEGREILEATARIHSLNGSYLYKRLPKDFRLGNVVHGVTLADYDHYRNIVEDTDVDYKFMCVAGASRLNMVEGIYRVLRTILSGRDYSHYHFLGIAAPPFVAILSWLMAELHRSGNTTLMTYDASTPIAATVNREYYTQSAFYNSFDRVGYGRSDSGRTIPAGNLTNQFSRYAMQDPIVNLIGGYTDFINIWPSHTVRAFVVYANIHALSRYTDMMNRYAMTCDVKTYKELLADQLKGSKHKLLALTAIDFITCVMQDGLHKAYDKFKFYMPAFTGAIPLKPFPLIGVEDEYTESRSKELKDNIKRTIANFDRWHSGKWKDAPTRFSKPNRQYKSNSSKAI